MFLRQTHAARGKRRNRKNTRISSPPLPPFLRVERFLHRAQPCRLAQLKVGRGIYEMASTKLVSGMHTLATTTSLASPAIASRPSKPTLCVDLDNSLVATDLL